jgi:hypothetical protein
MSLGEPLEIAVQWISACAFSPIIYEQHKNKHNIAIFLMIPVVVAVYKVIFY